MMSKFEPPDDGLTGPQGLVKVVLGAAAAYLAKKLVENAVESGFKNRRI